MKFEYANKSEKALKYCAVCGASKVLHTHELISKGAYAKGKDKDGWTQKGNQINLCSFHHFEFHTIGCETFAKKYHLEVQLEKARQLFYNYYIKKNRREKVK